MKMTFNKGRARRFPRAATAFAAACAWLTVLAPAAKATERRFTYTYESGVLQRGDVEIEPWTTFRAGRDSFYARFEERLEFEIGLTDRLQMAWYVNTNATTRDVSGERETKLELGGISSEWKLKLLDATADSLGLALYFEGTAATSEAELEGKVILDKRAGDFLFALNLVGEYEWEFEHAGELEKEAVLEIDGGIAYLLTPAVSLGFEVRSHNEFVPGEGLEHAALFAGPALGYSQRKWWTAMTVLPQVASLPNGKVDLEGHERVNARILFGFHL